MKKLLIGLLALWSFMVLAQETSDYSKDRSIDAFLGEYKLLAESKWHRCSRPLYISRSTYAGGNNGDILYIGMGVEEQSITTMPERINTGRFEEPIHSDHAKMKVTVNDDEMKIHVRGFDKARIGWSGFFIPIYRNFKISYKLDRENNLLKVKTKGKGIKNASCEFSLQANASVAPDAPYSTLNTHKKSNRFTHLFEEADEAFKEQFRSLESSESKRKISEKT